MFIIVCVQHREVIKTDRAQKFGQHVTDRLKTEARPQAVLVNH